ncbi:phage protein NinX family protein [Paraburkholderia mimosarum]|uniref:phage protein NinX family protein n=1 Tax=Paraburkholderia mimosarum TaxID=312026 RepID=UPI0039C280A2
MKVSELSGGLLELWVAICEGERIAPAHPEPNPNTGRYWLQIGKGYSVKECPPFASSWCAGGPIIERDQIFLQPPSEVHYNGGPNHGWQRYDHWRATVSARTRTLPAKGALDRIIGHGGVGRGAGETPLIAAMRAKVASHYGDEVPDEVPA